MLSSLTSFLPSRLQGAKELPRPAVIPDEQSDDEGDDADPSTLPSQPDNKPLKSRDRDGKGPSEVCFSLTCSSFWQAEWIVQTRISRDELDGTSSSYNICSAYLMLTWNRSTQRVGKTIDQFWDGSCRFAIGPDDARSLDAVVVL
jgi:hypothetical protein